MAIQYEYFFPLNTVDNSPLYQFCKTQEIPDDHRYAGISQVYFMGQNTPGVLFKDAIIYQLISKN
ncbi:hypothetical protein DF182_30915 [Chitinophaga flava]|uniref:Uncharacterized protein n=1 Tax=Chitinophaga flava TaxID=2259036 RepID=A0A365XZ35_9BACT|nr:hypothetical protein DF182_30915 [Chitinophaga flava]